jgi:nickel-dependent lactate racemase
MRIELPYGKETLPLELPDGRVRAVLRSGIHGYQPGKTPEELIEDALANPVAAPPLCELAKGKQKIVLIASDHTRPVPSKLIVPPMLRELRRGNPGAEITILIATGCHRETTREEIAAKFGGELAARERIIVHDCDNSPMARLGVLPGGGECIVNALVAEADLLVAEGFIEPHFFAGFSGGRKAVLPGVANRVTVLANHCSEFIAHPAARTGVLEGNPIHRDMVWAARAAKLAFIVNVVINERQEPIFAAAGDFERAHGRGCAFLAALCKTKAAPADIVVTTNGGYPLDQNIYQAVKGMTAAEASVRRGGVIIMLAKSDDGHGGEGFFRQMAGEPAPQQTLARFLARGRGETEPDQWQSQIFIRVLQKATVIYVSDAPDDIVTALHMLPARNLESAMRMAEELAGPGAGVTVIPDGVAVMVTE